MPHPEDGPDAAPSRSDLNLWAQALRNDWPIPHAVKRRLMQVAINLADPAEEEEIPRLAAVTTPPGGPPPGEGYDLAGRVTIAAKRDRTKLAALRVIAQFGRLTIEQQKLDLARERLHHGKDDEATEPAGGLDPARAANALRALNAPPTSSDS